MTNTMKIRNLLILFVLAFSTLSIYIVKNKLNQIKNENDFLVYVLFFSALIVITLLVIFFNKIVKNEIEIKNGLSDIKKLKNENEKLLLRYEHAIEGSNEGLWDWDIQNNEIYFSRIWKKMIGYEDKEIPNELNEWKKRVHPDDLEKALKDIEDNQKGITPHYQNIHRLKHKNDYWVWILDRGKTYFDKENNAIKMIGFHSDITEIKTLEMDLRRIKSELMEFKFIIENAPVCIILTDKKANISYVNRRFLEISGYYESEVIGKNPKILRYKDSLEEKKKAIELWERISNKKTWEGIFRNKKKNNEDFWVKATILPIINNMGEIVNYLGIMREITKEKSLERELEEKEEMMLNQSKNAAMGEMISMIAHQWRQPITTISMNANNIIADIELNEFDKDTIKEISKNIGVQTHYLSKTIDDFRNFFKKDKEKKEFKLKDLFDELDSILLASIKNNAINYSIKYDKNITLTTFKRDLLQVLLNLVKNAKEALIENNTNSRFIKIIAEDFDDRFEIKVLDNAGGIKRENLEKIFQPYFTTKGNMNGTGLGLYLSKMIVEKHLNGNIEVSNKNNGASFKISLKKQ